jgi:hypothetical protein
LHAASQPNSFGPATEAGNVGFRVASVIPEPGTGLLLGAGLAALGARRRLRGA